MPSGRKNGEDQNRISWLAGFVLFAFLGTALFFLFTADGKTAENTGGRSRGSGFSVTAADAFENSREARLAAPPQDTLADCRAAEDTGSIGAVRGQHGGFAGERSRYLDAHSRYLAVMVFAVLPFYRTVRAVFGITGSRPPLENHNINYIHSIDGKKKCLLLKRERRKRLKTGGIKAWKKMELVTV